MSERPILRVFTDKSEDHICPICTELLTVRTTVYRYHRNATDFQYGCESVSCPTWPDARVGCTFKSPWIGGNPFKKFVDVVERLPAHMSVTIDQMANDSWVLETAPEERGQ